MTVVSEVAEALGELRDKMIFVGGAIISLYTDDPAADEIRPTADIDMTISVLNYSNWTKLQEQLLSLGFSPDMEATHINRLLFKEIPIDIIPMEENVLGASNRWFQIGINQTIQVKVGREYINIFTAPVYLATKFEAFNSRGGDYRVSHDFEDIIYVLDNRTTIVKEVLETDKLVLDFIRGELQKIVNSPFAEEYLSAHIHPLMISERYPILINKIDEILGS